MLFETLSDSELQAIDGGSNDGFWWSVGRILGYGASTAGNTTSVIVPPWLRR